MIHARTYTQKSTKNRVKGGQTSPGFSATSWAVPQNQMLGIARRWCFPPWFTSFFFWKWNIRLWINTYRYIFRGMNIHLPAILMWTTGVQGFDTLPYWEYEWYYDMVWYIDIFWHVIGKSPTDVGQWFEMLPVWRVITMKHGIRSCNPLYHYAKPPHVRVFQGSQLEFIWTWKCVCVRLTCVFYVIKLRVNHPQLSP